MLLLLGNVPRNADRWNIEIKQHNRFKIAITLQPTKLHRSDEKICNRDTTCEQREYETGTKPYTTTSTTAEKNYVVPLRSTTSGARSFTQKKVNISHMWFVVCDCLFIDWPLTTPNTRRFTYIHIIIFVNKIHLQVTPVVIFLSSVSYK